MMTVPYPKVIPSRDKSRCPHCKAHGYLLPEWVPPEGLDPKMKKARCLNCGRDSYIGPKLKALIGSGV